VIVPGVLVTVVVMTCTYMLSHLSAEIDPMTWYADLIIPIGPLLVGVAAGSGYVFFSWLSGVKVSRQMLWLIAVLQLLAYVTGQYLEYVHVSPRYDNGATVPFFPYFDYVTQSFTFLDSHGGASTGPLGAWGYGIRVLEMLGFIGGGVAPLRLLSMRRFCEHCQMYMRVRQVGMIAAGAKPPVAGRFSSKKAEFAEKDAAVSAEATSKLDTIQLAAKSGDTATILNLVSRSRKDRLVISRLSRRLYVRLVACPGCDRGGLTAVLSTGKAHSAKMIKLPDIPLSQQGVRSLRQALAQKA